MKYNFENKNDLNDFYMHDSYFTGFSYDYENRQICFFCDNPYINKKFCFLFHNVILCNMQSCSFWGDGDRILYVCLEEPSPMLNDLIEVQNGGKNLSAGSYLNKSIFFLPIVFQLNSGDVLHIICESVDIEERPLPPEEPYVE